MICRFSRMEHRKSRRIVVYKREELLGICVCSKRVRGEIYLNLGVIIIFGAEICKSSVDVWVFSVCNGRKQLNIISTVDLPSMINVASG